MSMYEVSMPGSPSRTGYYGQPTGLGYAAAVAAILGPLVEGGAAIYGTTVQQKAAKRELKQRKIEFAGQQELQREAFKAQRAQFAIAQQAAIQQAQIAEARARASRPYLVAGLGLLALGLVGAAAARPRRSK